MRAPDADGVASPQARLTQDFERNALARPDWPMIPVGGYVIVRPWLKALCDGRDNLDAVSRIRGHESTFDGPIEKPSNESTKCRAAAGVAALLSRPAAMSPRFQSRSFESPSTASMPLKIFSRCRLVAPLMADHACDCR